MFPHNPGTYVASVISKAVSQKPGKCPQFVVDFHLEQFDNGSEWEPMQGNYSIIGYFTLINSDGNPNEINCQAIIDAFELPRFDIKTLETFDASQAKVQVVIDWDEYNGKKSLKVKYLNNVAYEKQTIASDPAIVQSLDQKYGAMLRAKFKPKNGSASAAPTTSAKKIIAPKTPDEAKRVAWAEFKAKTSNLSDAERAESFKLTVNAYGDGKDPRTLTIQEWDSITNQIAEFGPFQEQEAETVPPATKDDDLPF